MFWWYCVGTMFISKRKERFLEVNWCDQRMVGKYNKERNVLDMPKIVYIGNDKWYRCLECLVGLEGVDIVHVFIPKKSPKLIELCENNDYEFTFVKNINEHYQLISKCPLICLL